MLHGYSSHVDMRFIPPPHHCPPQFHIPSAFPPPLSSKRNLNSPRFTERWEGLGSRAGEIHSNILGFFCPGEGQSSGEFTRSGKGWKVDFLGDF